LTGKYNFPFSIWQVAAITMDRFATLILGYMVAVTASSVALVAITIAYAAWHDPRQWAGLLAVSPVLALFFGVFIGFLGFLPFCLVVMLARLFSIRTPIYYAIAGGLSGIAGYFPFWIQYQPFWGYVGEVQKVHWITGTPGIPSLEDHAGLFFCGLVGGLAYWAVAGRSAGWRTATSPEQSKS
jgi:hypothetical protein